MTSELESEMKFPIVLKGYAIFNPATGRWSRGGTGPNWGKNPKIWSDMGHLKSHLIMNIYKQYPNKWNDIKETRFYIRNGYRGCIVIDVTTGSAVEDFNIYAYYYDYIERNNKRMAQDCAVYEEP